MPSDLAPPAPAPRSESPTVLQGVIPLHAPSIMARRGGATALSAIADRCYAEGDLTRKAASYLARYQDLFDPYRDRDLRVLELGISSGASMRMWHDYLPRARIVGIDINPAPAVLDGLDRLICLQGSQDDPAVLDRAAELAGGPFDVIIDDASHIGYLTKRSFQYLFPRWLRPGGTYVIEDFGTAFMVEYPDGAAFELPPIDDARPNATTYASHQHGMVGVIKQFMDHMMRELMAGEPSWLAIERMTVMTNVAFIEKSLAPAGPMPSARDMAPPPSSPAPAAPDRAENLARDIAALDQRLSALETVVGGIAAHLAPLRRIARLFRRPG